MNTFYRKKKKETRLNLSYCYLITRPIESEIVLLSVVNECFE